MSLGTLVHYNNHRECGFIRPDDGSADLYLSGYALECADIAPTVGMRLSFEITQDKVGRTRAHRLLEASKKQSEVDRAWASHESFNWLKK